MLGSNRPARGRGKKSGEPDEFQRCDSDMSDAERVNYSSVRSTAQPKKPDLNGKAGLYP